MESEKVKEIKEFLEILSPYGDKVKYADILAYINELESENEDYYERATIARRENKQLKTLVNSLENQITELKDRIAELENTIKNNLQYTKGYGDGVKATVEVAYPKKLNEFAEMLKEKKIKLGERFNIYDIDETLKEFVSENIKGDN